MGEEAGDGKVKGRRAERFVSVVFYFYGVNGFWADKYNREDITSENPFIIIASIS